MLGSVSGGARVASGEKYCLSLRFRGGKGVRDSYARCSLATPLLQAITVSQHGTRLSSNTRIFLVEKIESCVKTSHFCALIENELSSALFCAGYVSFQVSG